jgi:hypothetical protein
MFKDMRTTADIAAIVTIILMAAMIRRRDLLLNAQRRANAMLIKSNTRLVQEIDDVLSER